MAVAVVGSMGLFLVGEWSTELPMAKQSPEEIQDCHGVLLVHLRR
jgi:hypothetical protein